MEEDQKSRHACKFCSKIFPCGRSLGGHMRSHLMTISSPVKKKQEKPILVDDVKLCKECGKAFQSWKALFRHMKCHSLIDLDHDHDQRMCRKKRSERGKRCTNSPSLSAAGLDQQEQEEVAWSLILLSMDCVSSVDGSCSPSIESLDAQKAADREVGAPRKRLKSNEDLLEVEVSSPKKNGSMNPHPFGSDHKKKRNSRKDKFNDSNNAEVNESKFCCIICKKGFPSYQALGGHRASHKKFRGCCAPTSHENTPQTDFQEKVEYKKSKEHECPICFKIFPTGQALGGHKRSHLTGDQARTRIPEIRDYLDLNLPAPVEEDCNEFKAWWISTPLLGLLSS